MLGLLILTIVCGRSSAGERSPKALTYFTDSFLDNPPVILEGVPQEYAEYDDRHEGGEYPPSDTDSNDLLSRARPRPDSPVYYIRLPPSPYMMVPGVGYVSRPPTLRPPPVVQPRPVINLPVSFVSNGKPTGVYTWKPDSPLTHLDKGPYVFNGRPSDIFLLRDTYNALYDDALQNFYP